MEINKVAAQGTNYLNIYGSLWQDLNTVPGREYILKFANWGSMPPIYWGDQLVGTLTNVPGYYRGWYYFYTYVRATSNLTRLKFEGTVLDDVSVGWLDEPVRILAQPQRVIGIEGGTASFSVTADGGPPLHYQWFFNGSPIVNSTSSALRVTDLDSSQAGTYSVIVSNRASSLISSNVTLEIEPAPRLPVIVAQPEGQSFPAGYGFSLRVVAIGTVPLEYQWRFNGTNLTGATNSSLVFTSVQPANVGTYTVLVSNPLGTVLSLPAELSVTEGDGGGYVTFSNRDLNAPIFDIDGVTGLTRSNYLAQVYAGPTPNILRPVSGILQFSSLSPGFCTKVYCIIPDVPANTTVYIQARAWEAAWGSSYEEARSRGGKFGFSEVMPTIAYSRDIPPRSVSTPSFSLRAGLAFFTAGRLEVGQRLPGGESEWNLIGASGFRYLIEKRLPPHNWVPLFVVTNLTGTVSFVDPDPEHSALMFYRSRILD